MLYNRVVEQHTQACSMKFLWDQTWLGKKCLSNVNLVIVHVLRFVCSVLIGNFIETR